MATILSSDSEDEFLNDQICHLVTTDMDSMLLRYPKLFGLSNIPSFCKIDDFRTQFKMSRRCFESLLNKIIAINNIDDLEGKLLFSIWMLCTQEDFASANSRFGMGSGGHKAFREVIDAIFSLLTEYVKWPQSNEYPEISNAFKDETGGRIPGIIGAINACHIEQKKPRNVNKPYLNNRKSYSTILLAVCDHREIFTEIQVGFPGKLSYHEVFVDSNIHRQIYRKIMGDYHIVGHTAYPLMKNLITPFSGKINVRKARFNVALNKATVLIEKAIKALRGRFTKLQFLDVTNPEVASKIISSCVILHNHIQMFDVNEDNAEFIYDSPLSSDTDYLTENVVPQQLPDGIKKRDYLLSVSEYDAD